MDANTAYYRGLAETALRMMDHPTSDLRKLHTFVDVGLTYGPSETWPPLLLKGWSSASMPDAEGHWPCGKMFERLAQACRDYLEETKPTTYKVVWDNGNHACGELPDTFTNPDDATLAGEAWLADMETLAAADGESDDDYEGPYTYEVVET
jgi:hypothetical protein